MTTFVGFAELDTLATPYSVKVGWAEFDTLAGQGRVCVGWAEFDTRAGDTPQPPIRFPGGGIGGHSDRVRWPRFSGNYDHVEKKYTVTVQDVDESEEEEILMQILMEVASHVI
jgi:hypothetical protein